MGNAAKQACKTEAKQFLNAYAAYPANHGGKPVTGTDTNDLAAKLYADKDLSSATMRYLSPVLGQGGTVATATSSRWTFDPNAATFDTWNC